MRLSKSAKDLRSDARRFVVEIRAAEFAGEETVTPAVPVGDVSAALRTRSGDAEAHLSV
jgi:hypothetical protein